MNGCVRDLITGVDGAGHTIIDRWRGPWLTVQGEIAGLDPIAEEAVVAAGIIRRVDGGIGCFVAGIDGAANAIIDWR